MYFGRPLFDGITQDTEGAKGTLQTLKNLSYAGTTSTPICSGHWESNERFPVALSPS